MNAARGGTILLLSKDSETLRDRAAQLALAGWRVMQVSDEIEMLSAVRTANVDLVIIHAAEADMLDAGIPNVLHSISPDSYLPVMVLAGSTEDGRHCDYLDREADDVISVDTSAAEMAARVRSLLRVRELYKQLAGSRAALQQALERERRLLSRLRRHNERLQALCTTDPLTHVQNVRSFRDILAHEFRVAKRYGHPISMLALDLDHFKVVNDTHGHPSGDYVLKETAVILNSSIRESDVVARLGGEEFGIVLPRADRPQAADFAERIRNEVCGRKFTVHGEDIHVTTSIGSASYPADVRVTTSDILVYFADQALLEAKEAGRDRVVAFGELPAEVRARLWRQYAGMPRTATGATSARRRVAARPAAPGR